VRCALQIRSPGIPWGVRPGRSGLARDSPIGAAIHHSTDLRHSKATLTAAASDIYSLKIRLDRLRSLSKPDPRCLSPLLFRRLLPQALFLLGFPCSLLAAELAQSHRTFVAPGFAAHLCPLVLLARSSHPQLRGMRCFCQIDNRANLGAA